MKKTKIIIACFLAALAVVGAGYAYLLYVSENKFERSARVYRTLTGEDAATAIENLDETFNIGEQWGYSSRELGQIISASSRAASAVGYLVHGQMRESGLYEFFRVCEQVAFECLAGQGDVQILDRLALFCHQIRSAGGDFLDGQAVESALEKILSNPEFEALMHSLGSSKFAADSDFRSLVGQDVGEREAKRIAEKYLGKNYAFKVSESELAYTVYASNISATISRKGGYLMQLMFDLPQQEVTLSEVAAVEIMGRFLSETVAEYELLVPMGLSLDGTYRMDFCPRRNGILCLDERISVAVTTSSGRVCLFDAVEYYRSRGGDIKMPSGAMTTQEVSELFGGESAKPCKVRLGAGVEAVCFRIGDFYVSPFDGKPIEGVKTK